MKKLSDVLKEVFWIKSFGRKTIAKKKVKKPLKKVQSVNLKKKAPAAKLPKATRPAKAGKPSLDTHLARVGEITQYFDRIKVCVVKITQGTILIGDKLTIAGKKSKFVQKVWSMQIESRDVKVAKKGQLIGLKVDKPVEVGDVVYK